MLTSQQNPSNFLSLCEECQKIRKRPMTNGVVVWPILSKDFASRGQVDLMDMQSMAHMNYKKDNGLTRRSD